MTRSASPPSADDRKQLTFMREWWSSLRALYRKQRAPGEQPTSDWSPMGKCLAAIFEYAFEGVDYKGSDRRILAMMAMVKDGIDAQRSKYRTNGRSRKTFSTADSEFSTAAPAPLTNQLTNETNITNDEKNNDTWI